MKKLKNSELNLVEEKPRMIKFEAIYLNLSKDKINLLQLKL